MNAQAGRDTIAGGAGDDSDAQYHFTRMQRDLMAP
ncbi:hypothetical protein [Profundibacter sp.]